MKTCFIVRKFGKEGSKERERADGVMEMMEEVLQDLSYKAIRSDQIRQSGHIVNQVLEQLHDADLVIVDLAGGSPNVYYELAVRHAFEKPAISLIDDPEKIPFDIADLRCLTLKETEKGEITFQEAKRFQKELKESIESEEQQAAGSVANPISNFRKLHKFKETAPAEEVNLVNTVQSLLTRLDTEVQQLGSLSKIMMDFTRKPLIGIEQILTGMYAMLREAAPGGRIWFAGMTLAVGPPHRCRRRVVEGNNDPETIDQLIRAYWKDAPSFSDMVHEMWKNLTKILAADKSVVITLDPIPEVLKDRFLSALSRRPSYTSLSAELDQIAIELAEAQHEIAGGLVNAAKIRYAQDIPLQILVVEKAQPARRGCLVFHVGTGNIGTAVMESGELGFYTEVDQVSDMFVNMVESLWEAARREPLVVPATELTALPPHNTVSPSA